MTITPMFFMYYLFGSVSITMIILLCMAIAASRRETKIERGLRKRRHGDHQE